MDNWRKFGNPDGKQPMEVSIALPTFLLEKEHHNTILIIYLIAMVVIIPCKRGASERFCPLTKSSAIGACIRFVTISRAIGGIEMAGRQSNEGRGSGG